MPFKCMLATSALAIAASTASAEMNFNRISSFPVALNNADQSMESSAEIISVSPDGMILAYSDSPLGAVGFIDISDPHAPKPLGSIDVGGEPTAVSIIGTTAFVGVNTSESYSKPSGVLKAFDITTKRELAACDLGGQPDSTATAKDGSFLTVAIENERDEDLGEGRTGQLPGGFVVTLGVADGAPDCDSLTKINVTGLAEVSPEDPEPEFVDINDAGEIVVTLQENNHIVIANKSGEVLNHFSAGSVTLDEIDTLDDGLLEFTDSQTAPREPDAAQWIDNDHFAIANEGDMDGGTRGWTIFNKDGSLVYEAGNSFEHAIIQVGHYPDKRSDSKGAEPEGMEFATFDGTPYAFILSERASVVGVYDVTDPTAPILHQMLPSGIAPEGAIAIPSRNLFVTANEADLIEDGGARSHVMLYEYQDAPAAYPQLTSEGADELIGWGSLSGMVAGDSGLVYAVSDGFYSNQPRIFTIDTTASPARIVSALPVTLDGKPALDLDLEGIALGKDGGFWLASDGGPDAVYKVDAQGQIVEEITLPETLQSVETSFGLEGITRIDDTLWMAVQLEGTDNSEAHSKLVAYNTSTKEWGAVLYPGSSVENGATGLSEITAHGDYVYVIERDNQIGNDAAFKKVYRVPAAEMQPADLGSDLPIVSKQEVRDLLPDLAALNGYIADKVEGLAIAADGTYWISTDNGGADDSSGETFFWSPGQL